MAKTTARIQDLPLASVASEGMIFETSHNGLSKKIALSTLIGYILILVNQAITLANQNNLPTIKASLNLDRVTNTSDADKVVAGPIALKFADVLAALSFKADLTVVNQLLENKVTTAQLSAAIVAITKQSIGLGNVENVSPQDIVSSTTVANSTTGTIQTIPSHLGGLTTSINTVATNLSTEISDRTSQDTLIRTDLLGGADTNNNTLKKVGDRITSISAGVQPTVYNQSTPSASWIINHSLSRLPTVTVYSSTGEEILAEVSATNSTATVIFGTATAGYAIIR